MTQGTHRRRAPPLTGALKEPTTPSQGASTAPKPLSEDPSTTPAARRYAALSPAQRLEEVWRKLIKPPKPRPGSKNAENARKAALHRAYMPWSDLQEGLRVYRASAVMSELTGESYVVDHEVPLRSLFVCGLHVHTNLRVVRRGENVAKGNLFWPGMPQYGWEDYLWAASWLLGQAEEGDDSILAPE